MIILRKPTSRFAVRPTPGSFHACATGHANSAPAAITRPDLQATCTLHRRNQRSMACPSFNTATLVCGRLPAPQLGPESAATYIPDRLLTDQRCELPDGD